MITLPILKIKPNPLDVLLATLGARLHHLSTKNHPQLTKTTQDKQVILQFVSDDGVARFFEFNQGAFCQKVGNHTTPNLTISFKNSIQGAKLLAKADTASLMKAIQEGDVTVTGDYKLVLWFIGVAKIATKLPEKYQGYIDTAKPYADKVLAIANKFVKK